MTTTTSNVRPTQLRSRLAGTINANGWFSIVSGAVLLVGAVVLDAWFDLPAWVIALVGASLIPYGLTLRSAARTIPVDRRMAWFATIGDLAWVIAAIALITIPHTMSAPGKWTLVILSLAVLDFAVLQLRELRHET